MKQWVHAISASYNIFNSHCVRPLMQQGYRRVRVRLDLLIGLGVGVWVGLG